MSGAEYNFACDKCPRTFKLEEFYEKHKKVHELKKQHKCDICGFVYGAAKGLEGHIKTHTDEEIAAAHQAANRQKASPKAGSGNNGNIPFGADFHFLNPQGVLAQAKIHVSPKKEDEVAVREQLNGKAPSPAGTGNYTIYGNFTIFFFTQFAFSRFFTFLQTKFLKLVMPLLPCKMILDFSCAPFANVNFLA